MAKSLAVVVVLIVASGCATTSTPQRRSLTDQWTDEAHASGLDLEQPLRLSPQTRTFMREKVGYEGNEKVRLLRLVRFVSDADGHQGTIPSTKGTSSTLSCAIGPWPK